MASLIRSCGVRKIFGGFKGYLGIRVPPSHAITLHKTHNTLLHTGIIRPLSAQRPIEKVSGSQDSFTGIDRALVRINTQVKRTGRIQIRDIEEILQEIKTSKHASSLHSQLLLRCCGSLVPEKKPEVRNKLVQEIWDTLHELQVPMDISHYNTLLRVYLENDHKFSPTQFLADLENRGITPNRVTYQHLIARYCQDGDIEGATRILEFMKEKELPVGENIFHSLITGHARSNDLESAHGVLEVMRSSGLDPTTRTYTILLTSYAEAGDMAAIETTLRECKAADLALHDRDLMEVIFALASGGHVTDAMQMMEQLQKGQGYNQDAINLIYRLLNIDRHQMAYLVFQSMVLPRNAQGEVGTIGAFFIKHLVRCGTDIPTIVHYCHEMKKGGMNAMPLETALVTALSDGHPEVALALMRVMVEDGLDIRTHYFWPIIRQYAKLKDAQNIYKTVEEMITMQAPLTLETFQSYVVPSLMECRVKDEDELITGLRKAGVSSLPLMVSSLVGYHIEKKDIKAAANVVRRYRTPVRNVLRSDLASLYLRSGNAADAVTVLGQMSLTLEEAGSEDKEGQEDKQDSENEVPEMRVVVDSRGIDQPGRFLEDVFFQSRRSGVAGKLEPLLQEMAKKGISISKGIAGSLKSQIGEEASETVLELLDTLASGDLTFQPIRSQSREDMSPELNIVNLEENIKKSELQNQTPTGLYVSLLQALARNGEVEKAEEVMKKLDAENYGYGVGLYALLIDMYVKAGNLDQARNMLAALEKYPDARLDPQKFLRLAHLMVQHGQIDEAIKVIETHGPENTATMEELRYQPTDVRRVLDPLVEKGDVGGVRRLTDALVASRVIMPSSFIFGPQIGAYLANDDVDGAMEEFEKFAREYKMTPFKKDLTTKCIHLEDGARLQKILDLSTDIHGEVDSLYDMVFTFLEAGRVTQARKLLNTPGLRARNPKLDQQCGYYVAQNKISTLENLVAATKNIFDVDHNMMFTHLFNAYKKQDDCDKALEIWTTMQEENIQPSETLLRKIGAFLKKHGREVPFTIPDPPPSSPKAQPQVTPPKFESPNHTTLQKKFRQAVRIKDFPSALSLQKTLEEEGTPLSLTVKSSLVEAMVQEGELSEAAKLTLEMLATNVHPPIRILKYLIVNMARVGDVSGLQAFKKYMDESMLKKLSFNNQLANSYCVKGRWQEVLDEWRTQLKNTQDSELPALENQIPIGSILGILNDTPSAYQPVADLAEEFAARGVVSVTNCLWMHTISEGRYTEAEEMYKKHLANSSRLMFKGVLKAAKLRGDPEVLEKLLACVGSHPGLGTSAKAFIYRTWIDILVEKQEFSRGLEVLKSALPTISLEELGNATLVKLKTGVEAAGNTFDYTIPPKNAKKRKVDSSSSSSSDSD